MLLLPRSLTLKQIWVEIQLSGDGFASNDEFNERYNLEDEVEARSIGAHIGAGSGGGWMDFSFSVENIDTSLDAFVELLREAEVLNRSGIEILRYYSREEFEAGEDENCQGEDTFQAGDALIFRYADGDYGAALVVRRTGETEDYPWYDKSLLSVLDYKAPALPTIAIFEQRRWFLIARPWNQGQRYLTWAGGCGVELFQKIGQIVLREDDVSPCQLQMDWELLAEMIEIERQRQ